MHIILVFILLFLAFLGITYNVVEYIIEVIKQRDWVKAVVWTLVIFFFLSLFN